jgi:hypothetical protein
MRTGAGFGPELITPTGMPVWFGLLGAPVPRWNTHIVWPIGCGWAPFPKAMNSIIFAASVTASIHRTLRPSRIKPIRSVAPDPKPVQLDIYALLRTSTSTTAMLIADHATPPLSDAGEKE